MSKKYYDVTIRTAEIIEYSDTYRVEAQSEEEAESLVKDRQFRDLTDPDETYNDYCDVGLKKAKEILKEPSLVTDIKDVTKEVFDIQKIKAQQEIDQAQKLLDNAKEKLNNL
jgi:hypothetical protein